jgi:hypothetical protein
MMDAGEHHFQLTQNPALYDQPINRTKIRESRKQMKSGMRKLPILFLVLMSVACGLAQKVKVGYDKSTDFTKYRSYTWHAPAITQNRPLLYANVIGSIRSELQVKELVSMDNDGDLTLIAHGGIDYGFGSSSGVTDDSCTNCKKPLVDPMEWTGTQGPPGAGGTGLPKGTLELQFIDRASNKVVWRGTVVQKLDPQKKQQSLEKVNTAIHKLLMEYPPKK